MPGNMGEFNGVSRCASSAVPYSTSQWLPTSTHCDVVVSPLDISGTRARLRDLEIFKVFIRSWSWHFVEAKNNLSAKLTCVTHNTYRTCVTCATGPIKD